MVRGIRATLGVAIASLVGPLAAQVVVHDADRRGDAPLTIQPNATHNGRPAHVVTGEVEWLGAHVLVEAADGSACDLVVAAGARLSVRDCALRIRGNLDLERDGRLAAYGSRVSLLSSFSREFRVQWRGGHLVTERCSIGGHVNENGYVRHTNFELHDGRWTLRDTVVRDSYGIVLGYVDAPPFAQGGTLDADGLIQGRSADAVILSGRGDATLRNSTFPVKIVLEPDGPQSLAFDLSNATIDQEVYGDAGVHEGVTRHIPGNPWRLELQNTAVPAWFFCVAGITDGGPPLEYTLENTSECFLRAIMHDVQGSTTLVGPWRDFYPLPNRLSDLPSARPPGRHGIPPGCGVRVGNATFRAPPNAWAYPQSWALNVTGNSNLALSGPMRVGEMYLDDTAHVAFTGDDPSQIGLLATTIDVSGSANLTVDRATVVPDATGYGQIEVRGNATCTLRDVVLGNMALRTTPGVFGPTQGIDNAQITVESPYARGNVSRSASPGGTIAWPTDDPAQPFGLANVGLDDTPLANGTPPHWLADSVTGSTSTTVGPLGGAASFRYQATAPVGGLRKSLPAVPGADFEYAGWVRAIAAPADVRFTIALTGANGRVEASPKLEAGTWTYVRLPGYLVGDDETEVQLEIAHADAHATFDVLLDGFALTMSQWWDNRSLANTTFEVPAADVGGGQSAPHHWQVWRVAAREELVDLPPGSATGSRAAHLTLTARWGQLYKSFLDLAPGQTIHVQGWAKALPHPDGDYAWKLRVAENNPCSWDTAYGNNVAQEVPVGAGWVPLNLTYTKPGAPFAERETRLFFSGGRLGAEILVDGFEVTVR